MADGNGRRMPVQQAVDVAVPVETAYNQWTQFEEWPDFMHRVTRVTMDDDCTVSFATKIWGKTKEFKAQIETQRPDERIKWRVSQGITHTGVVTFHELAPALTRIELNVDVDPGSLIEKAARGMRHIKRAMRADLHRFKAFIEMQELETGAWRGVIEDGELVEEHPQDYDAQREYSDSEEATAGAEEDSADEDSNEPEDLTDEPEAEADDEPEDVEHEPEAEADEELEELEDAEDEREAEAKEESRPARRQRSGGAKSGGRARTGGARNDRRAQEDGRQRGLGNDVRVHQGRVREALEGRTARDASRAARGVADRHRRGRGRLQADAHARVGPPMDGPRRTLISATTGRGHGQGQGGHRGLTDNKGVKESVAPTRRPSAAETKAQRATDKVKKALLRDMLGPNARGPLPPDVLPIACLTLRP
jgi:Polyketide cyclase / dehydrase and lipid transport